MREVEKDGVLIDVCPDCKGVWLDRGELDKLRTGLQETRNEYDRMERYLSSDDKYERKQSRDDDDDRSYSSQDHKGYDNYGKPYKKKKNVMDIFGDLFD